MEKQSLLLKTGVFLLLFVSSEISFAQCTTNPVACTSSTISTIGSGLTSNTSANYPAPYGNWYTSVRQQYLYTAAELNAAGLTAGKIDQIDFDVTTINGITTYLNYSVSIGCTSLSTFAVSPTAFESGLFTVFPSQTYTISLGWNAHTFVNAFESDGTSNIIIETCMNQLNPGSSYTQNSSSKYDTTSFRSSLVSLSDSQDLCAMPVSGWLSVYLQRPHIRLHNCAGTMSSVSDLSSQSIGMDIYPNPFNEQVTIELSLKESNKVQLEMYDLVGNKLFTVADEQRSAGTYKYTLGASDMKYASGIYILKLRTNDQSIARRIVLTK